MFERLSYFARVYGRYALGARVERSGLWYNIGLIGLERLSRIR